MKTKIFVDIAENQVQIKWHSGQEEAYTGPESISPKLNLFTLNAKQRKQDVRIQLFLRKKEIAFCKAFDNYCFERINLLTSR
ncbi:MAG: hypothetical protein SVO01_12305, partial [Thermotogota bacterium]|nr:hypothetical protein [Thermotogota bacterium]